MEELKKILADCYDHCQKSVTEGVWDWDYADEQFRNECNIWVYRFICDGKVDADEAYMYVLAEYGYDF